VVGVLVGPGLLWPPGRNLEGSRLGNCYSQLNLLVPSENLSIHDLFGPGMSMEKTGVE
jgi:hypothetical protein